MEQKFWRFFILAFSIHVSSTFISVFATFPVTSAPFSFTTVVTNQKCQPLAAELFGETGDLFFLKRKAGDELM